MIEEMNEKHVAQACQIHIEALPDSFLPMLGYDFLKVVYNSILEYNLGFGFVCIKEGKVVGFILACKNTGKLFNDIIKKKWFALILPLLKKIMRSPSLLIRVYETIFYPKKEKSEEIQSELLVIAVDKDYRRSKIGKDLVNYLNARFLQENIYKYSVSVYSTNMHANEFYKSNGFRLERSFTLYDKEFNVYEYELKEKRKTD